MKRSDKDQFIEQVVILDVLGKPAQLTRFLVLLLTEVPRDLLGMHCKVADLRGIFAHVCNVESGVRCHALCLLQVLCLRTRHDRRGELVFLRLIDVTSIGADPELVGWELLVEKGIVRRDLLREEVSAWLGRQRQLTLVENDAQVRVDLVG